MRIGVDATCWANGRGYGRFTRELVRAMITVGSRHEFICYLDDQSASGFDLAADNVRPVLVKQSVAPTAAASATSARSPLDMLRLSRAVARDSLDVFFSPSVYTYFPLPPGLPAVVTICDAIAERFPRLTLPSRRARLFWRLKLKLALAQAELILTISDFAADEVAEVHRVPRPQLRIASPAPAPVFRPSQSEGEIRLQADRVGLPRGARWLTYVGGFSPHKNLDVLIRAHARAVRAHGPLHLVMIGALEGDSFLGNLGAIRQVVQQCGTGDLVLWPGYLPDDAIRHLHSGAIALVLPSQNEGFGLPAVEAAACGTPVIATTKSPLPKLLNGGGLFIAPGDEDGLAGAIGQLAADPESGRRLGNRARERAAELSWPRAAGAALSALEEAAA